MSDPYFAEVLAACHTVESAKDAWVRFGAPAWRDLESDLAALRSAVEALAGEWERDAAEFPNTSAARAWLSHANALRSLLSPRGGREGAK